MQLSTIFASVVAVAATASAAPAATTAEQSAQAESQLLKIRAKGCDISDCIAALAPTAAVCAGALVEPTPFGEIACLALIWNGEVNTPAACKSC